MTARGKPKTKIMKIKYSKNYSHLSKMSFILSFG